MPVKKKAATKRASTKKAAPKKAAPKKTATKRASTKKVGAAKKNPNWKPSAAQVRNLPAAMIKGLRKYHTGR